MDLISEQLIGIVAGNFASLPKGLKQHDLCTECAYGGKDAVVNYCRRPADQECYSRYKPTGEYHVLYRK